MPKPDLDDSAAPAPAHEIRAELYRVLASAGFCNAPRNRRLLTHIVDSFLTGALRDLQEYAIGLTVFKRDAAVYSTAEDPIVRVQVGRLRQKLADYYASDGHDNALRIAIPLRSYVPSVCKNSRAAGVRQIAFMPLSYLGVDTDVESFNRGVNEELRHRLHQLGADALPAQERNNYRLEGSLRADCQTIRVSLRMFDASSNALLWSKQVDASRSLSIAQQSSLATACCRTLAAFLR